MCRLPGNHAHFFIDYVCSPFLSRELGLSESLCVVLNMRDLCVQVYERTPPPTVCPDRLIINIRSIMIQTVAIDSLAECLLVLTAYER